jgi:hypothetical protein
MAVDVELLRSGGVLPSGPVSAWPKERNKELIAANKPKRDTKVNVGAMRMARNLAQTTKQAVQHGKVSEEIREERYETCKTCPHFIEDSKRCSECGCFMEAKTWVGGDPDMLCPKQKWSR